jgi:hypothetical protein
MEHDYEDSVQRVDKPFLRDFYRMSSKLSLCPSGFRSQGNTNPARLHNEE